MLICRLGCLDSQNRVFCVGSPTRHEGLTLAGKRLAAVTVAAGIALPVCAHEDDILVGVDLLTNELELGFDWEITQFADFFIPGHPGWWHNDVKFEEDEEGNFREDRIPIDPGTEIVMIFENWHPALSLRPAGDMDNVYDQEGQELYLGVGGTSFAIRAWWYVDSTHPEYDPDLSIYTVDMRVIDLTGTHLPSVSYTLLVETDVERCVADMTGSGDPNDPQYGIPNGSLDVDDFFYYLDRFAKSDDEADLTGSSDPNDGTYGFPDGDVDADDFFFFLDVFSSGCRI